MFKKPLIIVLAVFFALTNAIMADREFETFDDETSASNHGWVARNMRAGNNFGFSNTNNAGGMAAGELGGTVSRSDIPISTYLDETIGTVTAEEFLYASGKISLTDINFDGWFYLGWSREEGGRGSNDRLLGIRSTDGPPGVFTLRARRQLDGDAGSSDGDVLDVTDGVYDFSFLYDPVAPGSPGLLTVTIGDQVSTEVIPAANKATTFDRFGLFTRDYSDEITQAEIYIDDLVYTSSDPVYATTAAPVFQESDNELDISVLDYPGNPSYVVKPTLNLDVYPPVLDTDNFSFSFVQPADPGAIGLSVADDGTVTWLDPNDAGDTLTIELKADNGIGQDTLTWVVTVVAPTAPDIEPIPAQTATDEYNFEYQSVLLAGNPNPTFSLDAPSESKGITVDPVTGVISWAGVTLADSPHTITVTADNPGGSGSETFTLTVSPGPAEFAWYVTADGSDVTGDGTIDKPFASLAKAVAATYDTDHAKILMQGGTYNVPADQRADIKYNGTEILGSWDAGWTTQDVTATPSIMDGGGLNRVQFIADPNDNLTSDHTIDSIVFQNGIFDSFRGYAIRGTRIDGLTVSNCEFRNLSGSETSGAGGAVSAQRSCVTIDNCKFINCKGYSNTAAIDLYEGDTSIAGQSIIRNCVFANNAQLRSDWDRGAACIVAHDNYCDLVVVNCTFNNNVSAASEFAVITNTTRDPCNVTVMNCLFENTTGGQSVAVNGYGNKVIMKNNLFNNTGSFVRGGAGSSETGTVSGNPIFFDATMNDYRIDKDSPAVDMGHDPNALYDFIPTLDILGNPKFGAKKDIGAYENQGDDAPFVAPFIAEINDQTSYVEFGSFSLQASLVAGIPDPTFTLDGAPAGMTIDQGGLISWPSPVAGTYMITVTATNVENSDDEEFTLTMLEVPDPKECQTFDNGIDPNNAGWTVRNMRHGNDFGFSNTNNAGGPSGPGEMGGTISRSGQPISSYMDETIGIVSLEYPLVATGKISINNINYNGNFYLGWYKERAGTGAGDDLLGIRTQEIAGGLQFQARRQIFGSGSSGGYVTVSNGVYNFVIAYDPDGGGGDDGMLTVTIGDQVSSRFVPAAQKGAGFNKFGLFTRDQNDSEPFESTEIFIDDLCYTSAPITMRHISDFSKFWKMESPELVTWTNLYDDCVIDELDLERIIDVWLTRTPPTEIVAPLGVDLDPNVTVTGTGFVEGTLVDGVCAYSNRCGSSYNWDNVPADLSGAKITYRDGGKGVANISVHANEDAMIYIVVPDEQLGDVDLTGWTEVCRAEFVYTTSTPTVVSVYEKFLASGGDINITAEVGDAWGGPLVIVGPNSTINPSP